MSMENSVTGALPSNAMTTISRYSGSSCSFEGLPLKALEKIVCVGLHDLRFSKKQALQNHTQLAERLSNLRRFFFFFKVKSKNKFHIIPASQNNIKQCETFQVLYNLSMCGGDVSGVFIPASVPCEVLDRYENGSGVGLAAVHSGKKPKWKHPKVRCQRVVGCKHKR